MAPVLTITERAAIACLDQGVDRAELEHMVEHAAINSAFPGFNRRYRHWLIDIRNGVCYNLSTISAQSRNQLQQ